MRTPPNDEEHPDLEDESQGRPGALTRPPLQSATDEIPEYEERLLAAHGGSRAFAYSFLA